MYVNEFVTWLWKVWLLLMNGICDPTKIRPLRLLSIVRVVSDRMRLSKCSMMNWESTAGLTLAVRTPLWKAVCQLMPRLVCTPLSKSWEVKRLGWEV